MKQGKKSEKMEVCLNVFLVVLFLVVIYLPIIGNIADFAISPKEVKFSLPSLNGQNNAENLFSLMLHFEEYYKQNFGFRDLLLGLNGYFHLRWLNVNPNPDVLLGKEDWLFYAYESEVSQYRMTDRFSKEELDTIQNKLEGLNEWFKNEDIHLIIIIVPNKHYIYPEFYPDNINKVGNESKLDQIIAHMSANSTVGILDIRPALIRAKNESQLYYKTDTHWNSYGAFIAYQEIAKKMSEIDPDIHPIGISDFTVNTNKTHMTDLIRISAMGDIVEDTEIHLVPLVKPKAVVSSIDPAVYHFMDYNLEKVMVMEVPDSNMSRLVAFGDSFFDYIVPYISEHFKKTVLIKYIGEFNKGIIMYEKPKFVILETTERNINDILKINVGNAKRLQVPASVNGSIILK